MGIFLNKSKNEPYLEEISEINEENFPRIITMVEKLHSFQQKFFSKEELDYSKINEEEDLKRYLTIFEKSFVIFLKDPKTEEDIAMITFGMEKEKNLLGDIIDIFIEEKYRSMGLGKKLIEKAITKLKELGSDRLSIGVFFDNTNARKLYEKLGFKPRHMRMFKFI